MNVIDSRSAGAAAIAGFIGIAVFQGMLALGVALGKAAWGGGSDHLSTALRVGSSISMVVWLIAAAIVAQRCGFLKMRFSPVLINRSTWALVGVMFLGSAVNWASRSPWERYTWGPINLLIALLCLIVAMSAAGPGRKAAKR